MGQQLGGHVERETFDRQLNGLRQRIATGKQRVTFAHLDDKTVARANHQRCSVFRSDDVRQYALSKDCFPIFQMRLPERYPLMHHRVLARDTVDEHIEATLLLFDALEKRLYFRFQRVIDPEGNRTTAGRANHISGLFDCFRSLVWRWVVARAAACAVNGRACLSERAGDAAARAPSGARDYGDLSTEWFHAADHSERISAN